jgi:hypothetical protein
MKWHLLSKRGLFFLRVACPERLLGSTHRPALGHELRVRELLRAPHEVRVRGLCEEGGRREEGYRHVSAVSLPNNLLTLFVAFVVLSPSPPLWVNIFVP